MSARLRVVSLMSLALTAAGPLTTLSGTAASSAATKVGVPLRVGCPSNDERVGIVGTGFSETVGAAQRVLYRELASAQGRRERRNAVNTPVVAVVTQLDRLTPPRVQGQRQLLARASSLCGSRTARFSTAVMFDDGLSILCCL
ncbi:MAG: hypothetical protein LC749_19045, partial [Actinobacteria bacterium]|nr:hypothetical protein [Actinomycetota bacterium]